MKVKLVISILAILGALTGMAKAKPFTIIVVTSNSTSEEGYTEFLQEIYRGNVDVQIEADRYKEHLSGERKVELEAADLIIVSR